MGYGQDIADRVEGARHGFSHRLRASHSWLVAADSVREVIDALHVDQRLLILPSLGDRPIRCVDVRQQGHSARFADELLIVDNSLATSFGCPASQLGAHVTIEMLDRVMGEERCGMAAVSVSRDARAFCRGIRERIDLLPTPPEGRLVELEARLEGFDSRFRQENDVAQTVAFYLACHPRVASVSYPGLPRDASFDVASRTLRRGFGPVVDFRLDDVGLEDVVRLADDAREGFLGLDAVDQHQTRLLPMGALGMGERTHFMRLQVGPCDPRDVVEVLEGGLAALG